MAGRTTFAFGCADHHPGWWRRSPTEADGNDDRMSTASTGCSSGISATRQHVWAGVGSRSSRTLNLSTQLTAQRAHSAVSTTVQALHPSTSQGFRKDFASAALQASLHARDAAIETHTSGIPIRLRPTASSAATACRGSPRRPATRGASVRSGRPAFGTDAMAHSARASRHGHSTRPAAVPDRRGSGPSGTVLPDPCLWRQRGPAGE